MTSIETSQQLIEKTIFIRDLDPVVILGFSDEHLNQLDRAFPSTKITARGNRIKILGPQDEVSAIEEIMGEMISIGRQTGNIRSQDVSTLLALADKTEGDSGSLSSRVPFTQDKGDIIIHTHTGEAITAKTPGQRNIVKASEKNDILFAIGPAGTGKTYTSVALAVKALKERKVKKIILARPAVEAGENLGFLPGDLKEKVDPYLRPLYDALEEMIEFDKLEFQLAKNTIEIAPLAYMRGRTLNNAFVILDEAQNATNTQMKMFLTRIGFNSRAIITGDITQTDLPKKQESGLISIQNILKNIDGISFVYLSQEDVVRHKLVRDIIDAYEKFENK
ncbi:PhoH family protein [Rhodohalobacter sp.]|uniref:PhoH family protein n=1 Tax=Rhodohalobacter sp. TaxID=1974210 RepID=UPI002ACF0073|nr:PhoH family protein [Rhodohalobacter sp.]MDZ7757930.1 PhoH family protein [Rhodohalobacter sp.]